MPTNNRPTEDELQEKSLYDILQYGARIYLVQNKMRYFLICYIINLRRNSLCQVKETITQSSLSWML